ncbi:hypothetical protein [Cereibacter sphaeroides]|uniref:hypothetical protein n=1 Tax=Cereibacter sphaeroides TaxID=1063 RepID=UPI00140FE02B|nr:hypothetical protein [Cereibacter sphaeroides]
MSDYPTRKAIHPHDLAPAGIRASRSDRRDADADLRHELAQIATLSGKPANLEVYKVIFRKWCALAVEDIEKRVRPAGHGDWRGAIGAARERLIMSMDTGPTPQAVRWRIRRREEWQLRSRHTAAVRLAMCDTQDDHLSALEVAEKVARYCRADFELMCEQVARVRLFRRLVQMPSLSAQALAFRRYIMRRDAARAQREAMLARLSEVPLKEDHVVRSADEEVGLPPDDPPAVPAGHVIVHRCDIDPTKISTTSSELEEGDDVWLAGVKTNVAPHLAGKTMPVIRSAKLRTFRAVSASGDVLGDVASERDAAVISALREELPIIIRCRGASIAIRPEVLQHIRCRGALLRSPRRHHPAGYEAPDHQGPESPRSRRENRSMHRDARGGWSRVGCADRREGGPRRCRQTGLPMRVSRPFASRCSP